MPTYVEGILLTLDLAQLISATGVIASEGRYEIKQWSTYLFILAIITFATASNIWGNKILGRWNDAACES